MADGLYRIPTRERHRPVMMDKAEKIKNASTSQSQDISW